MSLLDPKPLLPGKLDEAVTELATTPGSAFATAQSATIDTQVDPKIAAEQARA